MRTISKLSIVLTILLIFSVILTSCGNNTSSSKGEVNSKSYTVGGYLTGLTNGNSVIITNGADTLTLTQNSTFTFNKRLSPNSSYDVKIKQNPPDQLCYVENGTGKIKDQDITNIVIQCLNSYSIGGIIAGLDGTLTLSNNGENISLTNESSFTFSERYPGGTTYDIEIISQPEHQTCEIINGQGIISVSNITNIKIICNYNKYTLSANISNLHGTLFLKDDKDVLSISSDGIYTFPTPITYLYPYSVTILSEPPGQTCNLLNRKGIMYDNSFVEVTCETKKYYIGGTLLNLNGGKIILSNKYGNLITLTSNGEFTINKKYNWGDNFSISIVTQPDHQICDIFNSTGVVYSNIDDIVVTCKLKQYSIGGTVSTLYEDYLTLTNNGVDEINISSPEAFTFPHTLPYGSNYNISIEKYPKYQTCTISNYSGIVTENINNIIVNCQYKYYSVGGTVENLTSDTVYLKTNLGEILKFSNNTSFTFTKLFRDGTNYYVTILTQPTTRKCSIENNSGLIYGANITNVIVNCNKMYTLGGTITGTSGKTITIENYNSFLTLSTDGHFVFPNYYGPGDKYNVVVYSLPISYTCKITNGTGTFYNSNITNVIISCIPSSSGGYLDTTFNAAGTPGYATMFQSANPGTGSGDVAWDVVVDSQNRIIVTGWSDNGEDEDMIIWRFNEDGTIDHTFGQDNNNNGIPDGYDVFDAIAGYKQNDWGEGVTIDTNGKIIVTGYGKASAGNDDMVLLRLNSNGSLDTTFNGTGIVTNNNAAGGNKHDRGRDVILDEKGNIFVVGDSYYDNSYWTQVIWKYKPDGTLDTTFNGDGIFVRSHNYYESLSARGGVYSPATKDIIVNGFNNYSNLKLFEVDNTGTLKFSDSTDKYVGMKITKDANNNIIATGKTGTAMFIKYYNQNISSLNTSFNKTGVLTYDNTNGGTCEGDDVAVDKRGRIIVVGYCYNGTHNAMTVWRYNPDGTLDTTFNRTGIFSISGSAFGEGDDYAHGVAIDHKGRIIVVGESHNSDNTEGKMVIWRIIP